MRKQTLLVLFALAMLATAIKNIRNPVVDDEDDDDAPQIAL